MTTFNELVEAVYTLTNRPDLVKETQLAIKSATLQLHRSEFFYKDIFETAIKFDTRDFLQSIEYRQLFPRYRALSYLRKYEINGNVGGVLEVVSPTNILDSYNQFRTDICYVAGSVIQVRSSGAIEYALIGIYQNPDVAVETYNSWIAQEAMYAVVYKAASILFGTVLGDTVRMKTNNDMADMEFIEVKNSNIVAEGY